MALLENELISKLRKLRGEEKELWQKLREVQEEENNIITELGTIRTREFLVAQKEVIDEYTPPAIIKKIKARVAMRES